LFAFRRPGTASAEALSNHLAPAGHLGHHSPLPPGGLACGQSGLVRDPHTMHDDNPFRAPTREPKPGTFHRPAHGFGTKRAAEAAELTKVERPYDRRTEAWRGTARVALVGNTAPDQRRGVTRPGRRRIPRPTRRRALELMARCGQQGCTVVNPAVGPIGRQCGVGYRTDAPPMRLPQVQEAIWRLRSLFDLCIPRLCHLDRENTRGVH
jgi:hypothetical protein